MADRHYTFDDCRPRCDDEHSRAAKLGIKICRECGGAVEGRRQSWCSDECVSAYKKRARPIREIVYDRDKGICAKCGADRSLDNYWDVNHKIPLVEGGRHVLDNTETLCRRPCHSDETALLRERMKGNPRAKRRRPRIRRAAPLRPRAEAVAIARVFGLDPLRLEQVQWMEERLRDRR